MTITKRSSSHRRVLSIFGAFNDAGNLNAMSYQQMAEFNDFLIKVRWDPDCRVIVLTGEGSSFCAGFNLNDLALDPPEEMGRTQRDFFIMQTICSDQVVNMRACPQPIIGALKGHAVGWRPFHILCLRPARFRSILQDAGRILEYRPYRNRYVGDRSICRRSLGLPARMKYS